MTPIPTQDQIQQQLRAFLLAVLPAGTEAVLGQPNRVPEVRGANYVVFTPVRFDRIETNVDGYTDRVFTGSIAGATMVITAVDSRFPDATLQVGSVVFGDGFAPVTISAVISGSGQVGSYSVAPPATFAGGTLSAGTKQVQQAQRWDFRLDFHSDPSADNSGDMASTVSTLFRDGYAAEQFANQQPNYGVAPLYADDPAQRPYLNDQQQVESRWSIEALLQCNVMLSVPQQFADSTALGITDVDATFPP